MLLNSITIVWMQNCLSFCTVCETRLCVLFFPDSLSCLFIFVPLPAAASWSVAALWWHTWSLWRHANIVTRSRKGKCWPFQCDVLGMLVYTEYRLFWQFKSIMQNISKSLFGKNKAFCDGNTLYNLKLHDLMIIMEYTSQKFNSCMISKIKSI